MGVATITPDDPLLQFAGFVNLRRTRERASMDRYFANDLRGAFSDGPAQSPGTRVWWRTDAEEVAIVALMDKQENRDKEAAEYFTSKNMKIACAFQCPNEFVVGYGLDYKGKYRDLPFVGILKPEVFAGSE